MARKAYVIEDNFTKRDLPDLYTHIDFIESSGTQAIDTGFKPKHNTRVVMELSNLANSAGYIFGARNTNSETAPYQYAYRKSAATQIKFYYFGRNAAETVGDTTGRTILDMNGNTATGWGVTVSVDAVADRECSHTLTLFGINDAGTIEPTAVFRLHSCKIYDGDTLVRDYVPCKTKSGVIGLYDLVGGFFYTNVGTGSFIAGDEYRNAREVSGIYVGEEDLLYTPLPDGYKRVECIESSGTQYINTGVNPNQDTRVFLDADVLATNNTGQVQIVSVSDGTRFFVLRMKDDFTVYQGRRGTGSLFSLSHGSSLYGRHLFDLNKSVFSIDGIKTMDAERNFEVNYPLYICAQNNKGSATGYSKLKIYSCRIYKNDELVRNFVPCLNPDWKAGLYDTVEGRFYGDSAGGVFSVWSVESDVLPEGYTRVSYAESAGSQHINTGFVPNQNSYARVKFHTIDNRQVILGSDANWGADGFCIACGYTEFSDSMAGSGQVFSTEAGKTYEAELTSDGKLYVNGSLVWTATKTNFTAPCPVTLFALNRNGDVREYTIARIMYVELGKNNVAEKIMIPCVNAEGAVGMFDIIGGSFYGEGSGSTLSAGENVPVAAGGGIARKVKKGYVSVGRKARPFWGEDPAVSYYGDLTSLSVERGDMAAASNGEYVMFVGGRDGTTPKYSRDVIDVYSKAFVRTQMSYPIAASFVCGKTLGDMMIFAGGRKADLSYSEIVCAYNKSLTMSLLTPLSIARTTVAAVNNGVIIFAGGTGGSKGTENFAVVDAYNESLTRINLEELQNKREPAGGASAGEWSIFVGGGSALADAYNASLTRVTAEPLSERKYNTASISFNDHAIFAGGSDLNSLTEVYDANLARRLIDPLDNNDEDICGSGVALREYATICFGDGVETYNFALVHSVHEVEALYDRRNYTSFTAVEINNFALCAGGFNLKYVISDVAAYTVL